MIVAAIVLAAGASERMGQPKALLQLDGQTLVAMVLSRLREVGVTTAVVAIAAPHGALVQRELEARAADLLPLSLRPASNPAPELGMLSSVQCALRCLLREPEPPPRGALIWPVDIPRVQADTLRRVIESGCAHDRLVVPTHNGRGGHPLWLPRALFAETQELSPTVGLRELRRRHPELRLPIADAEILRDLDTPQDLQRLAQP